MNFIIGEGIRITKVTMPLEDTSNRDLNSKEVILERTFISNLAILAWEIWVTYACLKE
jgi:hypothetical protein